jgi:YgiT-type zinc finger domain-containing protein
LKQKSTLGWWKERWWGVIMSETFSPSVECPHCGKAMRADLVKTTIWKGDRLFVVEDIPAQVCDACVEQYYDEETTDVLRRLTEDGFPAVEAKGEILVPVFTLKGRALLTNATAEGLGVD